MFVVNVAPLYAHYTFLSEFDYMSNGLTFDIHMNFTQFPG